MTCDSGLSPRAPGISDYAGLTRFRLKRCGIVFVHRQNVGGTGPANSLFNFGVMISADGSQEFWHRRLTLGRTTKLSDSRRRAPVERTARSQITRDSQTESAAAVRCSALVRLASRHTQNLRSKNPLRLGPNQAPPRAAASEPARAVRRSNSQNLPPRKPNDGNRSPQKNV